MNNIEHLAIFVLLYLIILIILIIYEWLYKTKFKIVRVIYFTTLISSAIFIFAELSFWSINTLINYVIRIQT